MAKYNIQPKKEKIARYQSTDKRYARMSVEDISEMAGFNTRQSFYANFFKRTGVTPRQYRASHFKGLE